jgi:hypothetical protein
MIIKQLLTPSVVAFLAFLVTRITLNRPSGLSVIAAKVREWLVVVPDAHAYQTLSHAAFAKELVR